MNIVRLDTIFYKLYINSNQTKNGFHINSKKPVSFRAQLLLANLEEQNPLPLQREGRNYEDDYLNLRI